MTRDDEPDSADDEREVPEDETTEDEFRDHEDEDDGPTAVDDRGPDDSVASNREPLGDLREQVVDDEAADSTDVTDSDDEAAGSTEVIDSDDEAAGADPTVPETDRDGPLGELAAGIDGRRERKTAADEELFEEVEVGEVDADELWSQVESDGPTVEPRGEREIREVRKRKYCSQCPYFSEPPEVACSHEGTDILQQVDMEHFEVADCPVILEDERLEDVTTE